MSNEELISEYVNRAGVTSDTKFMVDHLNQVLSAYNKLGSIRVGLNGIEEMRKIIPATKEAGAEVNRYENSVKNVTARIAELNGKSKEFTEVLLLEAKATKELELAQKAGNQASIESAKVKLLEAKAATELAKAKLYEAQTDQVVTKTILLEEAARNRNAAAADKEAAAVAKAAASKGTIETEILPTVQGADIDVDSDAIDARNAALREQKILEAEAAGSTSGYVEAQKESTKATVAATQATTFQLGSLEANILTRAQLKDDIVLLQKAMKEDARLLKEGDITQTEYNKRITQGGIEIEQYKKRVKELDSEIKRQTLTQKDVNKLTKDASNEYKQLSLAYNEAALKAKNYNIALGANHPLTIAATRDAKLLDDKLKEVDKSVGQSQRNVGNYGGAFTKAFGAIRTAANILPGIGIAGIFGFIFEAVSKATEGIFNFVSAISSIKATSEAFNGAKSAFVDAVTTVSDLRNEISLAKDGFAKKDDVVKHYNETIGKTTGFVNNLIEAEQGLQKNADAYIKYTLLKAAAAFAGQKAAEKLFDATMAEQKAAKEFLTTGDKLVAFGAGSSTAPGFVPGAAQAGAEQRAAYEAAQSKKRKDAAIKASNDEKKVYEDVQKSILDKANLLGKEFGFNLIPTKVETKDIDKTKDSLRKAAEELFKYEQGILIEQQKDYVSIATSFAGFKVNARIKQAELERELINKTADYELQKEKLNADQITLINRKRNEDLAKVDQRRNADIERYGYEERKALSDQAEETARFLKSQQDAIDRKEIESKKKHKDALQQIDQEQIKNQFDESLTNLDSQYLDDQERFKDNKEELQRIEKKYNENRLKLQTQSQLALLQSQIEFAQKQLEIDEQRALASGDQEEIDRVRSAQNKLKSLQIQAIQAVNAFKKESKKKEKEDEEKEFQETVTRVEKVKDLALGLSDAVSGLFTVGDDKKKNAIQEQIDALEAQKQKDIEVANQSILNAEQRAAAITVIEARAQAKREELERRQRQLDERRARFEKVQNIATAIAETTIAVLRALGAKPWTPGNIALAATVGLIGTARIAALAAAPIPKYRMGTKDHPGGLAEVGHGKGELVEQPDGKMFVTPSTPTVLDLPKHTIVHPDAELAMKMGFAKVKAGNTPSVQKIDMSGIEKGLSKMERNVVNAIQRKKETQIVVEHPIKSFVHKSGDSFTDYLNRSI